MSGKKQDETGNTGNIRVYIVDCEKTHVVIDRNTDINMFADEAKRQGTAVTLPCFLKMLNDYDGMPPEDTPNFKNCFIRMAVVADGVTVREIMEV